MINKANIPGYIAILLWSFSALFISFTTQIPSLLLAGLSSIAGFSFFALSWIKAPEKFMNAVKQSWQIWLLYFLSVVAYRGFFLAGLKLAPIIEANLLNYLWPLLIILLSGFMDHQKIPKRFYWGSLACFAGIICIGLCKKGGGLSFETGHFLAVAGAFTWAFYSVITRRFPHAPIDMIGLMHLIAAGLFIMLHSIFEKPVDFQTISLINWLGVMGLGLAISLGYSLWDKAMTYGNRETVAVAAYYTPLLSTLWLILLGNTSITTYNILASILIISGSLYARMARDDK